MTAPFALDPDELARHDRFVRGLARVLVLDPHRADDVAQAAWLAALAHRAPAGSVRAWLATLVRHFASNARRSAARIARRERAAARPEAAPSPAEIREREAARHAVVEAVLALDEPYRTTVVLRFLEGLPPRAVARRMGVPVETVRTRARRALELLRGRLAREHGGGTWRTALLPLARGPGMAPAVLASIAGALIVTTKTKLAVAAGIAAALSLVLWQAFGPAPGRADGAAPHRGAAAQAVAPGAESRGTETAVSRSEVAAATSSATTGALLVRVVWEDGPPAAGVAMVVRPRGVQEPEFAVRVVHTDAHGEAHIADLPAGPLRLLLDRERNPRTTEIAAGRQTELVVTLDTGYAVRGLVVDGTGAPIGGAEVLLGLFQDLVVEQSAADGTFMVRGLSGIQYVAARAAGYARSPSLQIWWGKGATVSVTLTLAEREGRITGIVHDEHGAPVADAIVELAEGLPQASRVRPDGEQVGQPIPVRLSSNASGRFSSGMLPSGPKKVRARAPGNALWRGEVRIEPDRTATLDIGLVPGATVFGVVRDARGEPEPGAEVRLAEASSGLAAPSTITAADGSYELRGLAPGAADLTFSTRGRGKARAKVTVLAGERVRCDARLDAGLQLAGRVVDARGAPVADVGVEGLAEGPERWSDHARTDAEGRFRLVNCNDAPVRLLVRSQRVGMQKMASKQARPGPDEVVITLDDVREETVWATGRVLLPNGEPCCGASVLLFGLRGGDRPRGFTEPSTGAFRLGPVSPGRYQLTIDYPGQATLHRGPRVLQEGETWDLGTLQLPPPGTLDVHVVRPDRKPLPSGSWLVVAPDGSLDGVPVVDGRGQRQLAPGAYVLRTGWGDYADQELPFTIEPGQTHVVEVALVSGTSHVLRARLPDGDQSERIAVVLRRESPPLTLRRELSRLTTGALNELKVGLAPGSYEIEAKADSGARVTRTLVVAAEGKPEPVLLELR